MCLIEHKLPYEVDLNTDEDKALVHEPTRPADDYVVGDLVLRYIDRRARSKTDPVWKDP